MISQKTFLTWDRIRNDKERRPNRARSFPCCYAEGKGASPHNANEPTRHQGICIC